jgi:hypothetical protein
MPYSVDTWDEGPQWSSTHQINHFHPSWYTGGCWVQTYWSLILSSPFPDPSQFEKWCKLGKHCCCSKTLPQKKESRGVNFFEVSKFCQLLIKTLILQSSPIKAVSVQLDAKTLILLSSPIYQSCVPSWMLKKPYFCFCRLTTKESEKKFWLLKSCMTHAKGLLQEKEVPKVTRFGGICFWTIGSRKVTKI